MPVRELTELSEAAREQALLRYRLIEAHLARGVELRSAVEQSGVSFRTLQRWAALYRKHGLASLARQSRLDRDTRRAVLLPCKWSSKASVSRSLPSQSVRFTVRFATTPGSPVNKRLAMALCIHSFVPCLRTCKYLLM